ncbi:MAG: hypothetical protein CVV22_06795 [Ignavibacteriae bacterium HGW-Ignavibacteriae-1]|jgi:hypothetical protein|nr:MAG: hypothetical protein CVV22_06795 [Ignavibacteriae bacterium HGW-Ignavibacteriae-1]
MKTLFILIVLFSSFLMLHSQDYIIKKHVFGSSAQTASNAEHVFKSTVGQSTTGNAENDDIKLFSGFWKLESQAISLQSINLIAGWNMISTYLTPTDTSIEMIFAQIVDDIVIVKNNIGQIYYPEFSINDIGNWSIYEGYQVYTSQSNTLEISGQVISPQDTPINLGIGWSIVPYLRSGPMNIEDAMQSLTDDEALVIAKNNLGQIYYPAFGINDIGNMLAGQGYQIYLIKTGTLTYP